MDKDARRCAVCGRQVSSDEAALTRKLINRGTSRFLCLSCLSEHFQVSTEELQRKIREFKAMGCTLFENAK